MAKRKRPSKIRTNFRKRHDVRKRQSDLTRKFQQNGSTQDDEATIERVSGKGALTRKRTIIGAETSDADSSFDVQLEVDESVCLTGRVLCVHGLESNVSIPSVGPLRCTVRGILKSLTTDQRHVVVTGDVVLVQQTGPDEGVIQRIEPRRNLISRTSSGRQHVIASNVDQMLIVASAAQPNLKPNLIDRLLITAEKAGIEAAICINKVDLIETSDLQPLVGVYGQMGYRVLLLSAKTGLGIEHLLRIVPNKDSVVLGQSGVGKSSLLNRIDPSIDLRVREVSSETEKGKHTTSATQLIPLPSDGHLVDTPGIRQFQLWDVIPEEVEGFCRDLRPLINRCRFPDCTHRHEADCAVKDAVADGWLDARRYESYCQMFSGDAV